MGLMLLASLIWAIICTFSFFDSGYSWFLLIAIIGLLLNCLICWQFLRSVLRWQTVAKPSKPTRQWLQQLFWGISRAPKHEPTVIRWRKRGFLPMFNRAHLAHGIASILQGNELTFVD